MLGTLDTNLTGSVYLKHFIMASQQEQPAKPKPIDAEHPLTGRCFCGAITYSLASPPLWSYLCHCLDCRRFSGTSFAYNATLDNAALKILTPRPESIDHVLSTFGDKANGMRQFCSKCGSPLFMTTGEKIESMEDKVIIAVGTIDGSEKDERLKPVAEGWCKRRETWLCKAEGTEESEEW